MMTHLDTLEMMLSNERTRMMNSKTDGELALRKQWVRQIQTQVNDEKQRQGFNSFDQMTDEELMKALEG